MADHVLKHELVAVELDFTYLFVLIDSDHAIDDFVLLVLICPEGLFDGIWLVPVIRVNDSDKFASGKAYAFIHGIVDTVIFLRYDSDFVWNFFFVFIYDGKGVISGLAIDDDVLEVCVILGQDGV